MRRRTACVGRAVDVGLPTAGFTLDASPGRHLAVLGTTPVGADVLSAADAVAGPAARAGHGDVPARRPGRASADDVVDDPAAALKAAGHQHEELDLPRYREAVVRLGSADAGEYGRPGANITYLVVFGADVGSGILKQPHAGSRRNALDELRAVFRDGPMRGVHVLGWWRGVRRFTDDLGSGSKEDVAGLVALNVRGSDFATSGFGDAMREWAPRENRALFVDRSEDRVALVVPFVREGRFTGE